MSQLMELLGTNLTDPNTGNISLSQFLNIQFINIIYNIYIIYQPVPTLRSAGLQSAGQHHQRCLL